jgi:hypothetical protein
MDIEMLGNPEHQEIIEAEGYRYLGMLGLGHLSELPMFWQREWARTYDGSLAYYKDFLNVCGRHALPLLLGLDELHRRVGPEHPKYTATRDAIAERIGAYAGNVTNRL